MSKELRIEKIPKEKLKSMLIDKGATIKETMRLIDRNGMGIAFVVGKAKRPRRKHD